VTLAIACYIIEGLSLSRPSTAVPIAFRQSFSGVDWTSAGVGGTGGGGGTITLSGVTGSVTHAFLYWHGIDTAANGGNGVYDNATVTFAGTSVEGIPLGDSSTNCWGAGSSRAFRADVTALVGGDGAYAVSGLSASPGHNANGASLLVLFDDGDAGNDRDLAVFEGNDASHFTFDPNPYPGENDGWHAALPIHYTSGAVGAQVHVSDGQSFADGPIAFKADATVTIADTTALYDGNVLPTAGTSRAGNGSLWDIHGFDITAAFTGSGAKDLKIDFNSGNDCVALVVLLVDLAPGSVDGLFNDDFESGGIARWSGSTG
jgi:hypothetical protein